MNTRLRSNIIRGMPGGPIINNDFCSCEGGRSIFNFLTGKHDVLCSCNAQAI